MSMFILHTLFFIVPTYNIFIGWFFFGFFYELPRILSILKMQYIVIYFMEVGMTNLHLFDNLVFSLAAKAFQEMWGFICLKRDF